MVSHLHLTHELYLYFNCILPGIYSEYKLRLCKYGVTRIHWAAGILLFKTIGFHRHEVFSLSAHLEDLE